MTDHLPANQRLARKDAYFMLVLKPIEDVTRSLLRGDTWELRELQQVANRCRALADAFDARIKEVEGHQ